MSSYHLRCWRRGGRLRSDGFKKVLLLGVSLVVPGSAKAQESLSAQLSFPAASLPELVPLTAAQRPTTPLSPGQQFPTRSEQQSRFVRKTFGWQAVAAIGAGATFDQLTLRVPAWGSNAEGFEKRVELRTITRTTGSAVEYGMTQLLHTDTSYHRCQCRGFQVRTRHALLQTFLEYRADGAAVPAYSRLVGNVSGLAISAGLLPRNVSTEEMAQRGAIQLGTTLGMNVVREFWPEIKRQIPANLRRR